MWLVELLLHPYTTRVSAFLVLPADITAKL